MRSTRLMRVCAATAIIAGVGLSTTAAWAADPTTGLQSVKDAAHTAITNRVTALGKTITTVNTTTFLGGDQAALVTEMQTASTGLTNLDTTIQADTSVAAARADAQKIYTDFRVYALVLPATQMVVATDAVTNVVVPKLTDVATTLQTLITKTGATGQQVTLDDMKAQIAAASTATNGLATQLEGFTPAQWNANHDLLSPDRAQLKSARADLAKARQDAKSIVAALVHA